MVKARRPRSTARAALPPRLGAGFVSGSGILVDETPGALAPARGLTRLMQGPSDGRSRHAFLTPEAKSSAPVSASFWLLHCLRRHLPAGEAAALPGLGCKR